MRQGSLASRSGLKCALNSDITAVVEVRSLRPADGKAGLLPFQGQGVVPESQRVPEGNSQSVACEHLQPHARRVLPDVGQKPLKSCSADSLPAAIGLDKELPQVCILGFVPEQGVPGGSLTP